VVLTADTGRAALEMPGAHPDTEAVLMDVMMPGDGRYEAMRRIAGRAVRALAGQSR